MNSYFVLTILGGSTANSFDEIEVTFSWNNGIRWKNDSSIPLFKNETIYYKIEIINLWKENIIFWVLMMYLKWIKNELPKNKRIFQQSRQMQY